MDATFWWLFPVSIVIAATANGAGIGGATFFAPLFVIGIGLDPVIAIGAALLTEVFGFASGVIAHARAKAIDWLAVRRLVVGIGRDSRRHRTRRECYASREASETTVRTQRALAGCRAVGCELTSFLDHLSLSRYYRYHN